MKKHLFFAAIAGVALASCSSDDFIGNVGTPDAAANGNAISIGGNSANITRAAVGGQTAADLLGGKFRVLGTVTKNGTPGDVFDNYVVKWDNAGVGVTKPDGSLVDSTNVYGWSYLGETSLGVTPAPQQIKYWDLQASQYDFVAFSGIDDAIRIASVESNTFDVTQSNYQKIFMSNHVLADYAGTQGVQYGNKVTFTFSRMAARLRVGFYETVPGYAVANVRFYFDGNLLTTNPTKAESEVKVNGAFPQDGQYKVTYNAKGEPVANFATGTKATSLSFGALQYGKAEVAELEVSADGKNGVLGAGENKFLGTSSSTLTWAKGPATLDGTPVALSDWQSILPYPAYNETDADDNYINRRLTIRVDYDLVPLDGGPVINVYNASAVVPYEYAMWKPNHAYTYIFKISDKTSGSTLPPYIDPNKDTDGDGIPDWLDPDDDNDGIPDESDPDHVDPTPTTPDVSVVPDPDTENPNPTKPSVSPIVFDAEVSSIEDYNQETITGVTNLGGDAITTYSSTSKVTDAAEYAAGEVIQVSSPSHGQWKVAYSSVPTTEKAVADNNSFSYDIIGGETTGEQTIDEASVYTAKFTAANAGYYVVWLRYLPTGMTDVPSNYVDVFKVVKIHN